MKLEIGKYIVDGDGTCVSLLEKKTYQKGTKIGQEYQVEVGHYADLDQALQRLLSEEITGEGVRTAREIILQIKAARRHIATAVNRVYCRGIMG